MAIIIILLNGLIISVSVVVVDNEERDPLTKWDIFVLWLAFLSTVVLVVVFVLLQHWGP